MIPQFTGGVSELAYRRRPCVILKSITRCRQCLISLGDLSDGLIQTSWSRQTWATNRAPPTINTMKTGPQRKFRALRSAKHERAASLGRSHLTGAHVLKPVAKGASISLDDVRRLVRTLKPIIVN